MSLRRSIFTACGVLALAGGTATLPATAAASYHVDGTEYGIPATASNNLSPPFAGPSSVWWLPNSPLAESGKDDPSQRSSTRP